MPSISNVTRAGIVPILGLLAIGVAAAPAAAADFTWTQPATGTASNWSAPADWSPGVPVSAATSALIFNVNPGAVAYTFTNDIGSFTLNSLTFNNFSTSLLTVDLGANPVTLAGTTPFFANNGPGNVTIPGAGGIVLSADVAFASSGNGTMTISSIISGTANVTVNQTGNGVIALSGANSFLGSINLNSGVLSVAANAALGDSTNGLVFNGGIFRPTAAITASSRNLTINAGGAIVAGTVGFLTTGNLSGSGPLTKLEAGNLTLQGANASYTGAVTIGGLGPMTVGSTVAASTSAGGIILSEGGQLNNASSITINTGALMTITRGTSSLTAADRIGTRPIFSNGGMFTYSPGSAAPESTSTLGNVTISGKTTIRTAAVAGDAGGTNLNFGTLTRIDNAVLTLGANTSGTGQMGLGADPNSLNLRFTNVVDPGGSGVSRGIIPWAAFTGSSATTGSVNGTFEAMQATYDSVNGFRPLTASEYNTGLLAGANCIVNTATALPAGGIAINSLNVPTTSTITGNATNNPLTISSGNIVNYFGINFQDVNIVYPSGVTGYIHQGDAISLLGTSSISGNSGLVITSYAGSYRVTMSNTAANTFTGGLYLYGRYTGAAAVTSGVVFTRNDQLGALGENIFMSGAVLNFTNTTTDESLGTRNIKLNGPSLISIGTAARTLTIPGTISGQGALAFNGPGIVNLTSASPNTYSGGTQMTAGVLQISNGNQLGTGELFLSGGTLRANGALVIGGAGSPPAITLSAASTIDTQANNITISATLASTTNVALTKTGAGTLTLTGASPRFGANITYSAGNITLSGAGALPQLAGLTVNGTATFTMDNSSTYVSDRLSNFGALTLGGSVASYIAPSTVTPAVAERFGQLGSTALNSVFSITGGGASPTVLRISSLNLVGGNLTIRGTDLGGTTGNYTRLLIDAYTTNQPFLPNVFFANTPGAGTSSTPAGYDTVRGLVQFTPTPFSGISINNLAPENVPISAAYTTTGSATVKTGAAIYSLVLDGGSTLTMNGGNAASGSNNNTPNGTFSIFGGILTSQNGPKSVVIGDFATPTIAFGAALAQITTTSDLTINAGINVTGTAGLTKLGTGTLTIPAANFLITGNATIGAGIVNFGGDVVVNNLAGAGTLAMGTGALTVNSTASSAFTGSITGGSTLTKTGTGAFTLGLATAATYAGGTIIANGTMVLGTTNAANAVLPNFTLGSASGNTNGILDLNGFSPAAAVTAINFGGTGTGHQITNGNTLAASTLNFNFAADYTYPVSIGGNVIVNKTDASTLQLTGATSPPATTTGVFNVNAGTLQINVAGQGIGVGMGITVGPTGTLRLNGANTSMTAANSFGTVTVNGGQVLNNGTGWFDLALNRLVVSNGATYSVTASGTPYLIFNGAGAGIQSLASANQVVLGTGTLPLVSNAILNNTSAALPIDIAAGTVPGGVDVDSRLTFSTLGSNPNFQKLGAGTLQISNTSNSGNFIVTAGRLFMSGGSTSGTITVNSGGTLAGTGSATTAGAVTIASGGRLSPGASIGTFSINAGSIVFQSGGHFDIEYNQATSTPVAGTDNDFITGSGASALNLSALGTGGAQRFNINLYPQIGIPPAPGGPFTYTIADFAGGITLPTGVPGPNITALFNFGGAFTGVPVVNVVGTQVQISFTPVPEPMSVMLLCGGAAGVVAVWRRRRFAKVR